MSMSNIRIFYPNFCNCFIKVFLKQRLITETRGILFYFNLLVVFSIYKTQASIKPVTTFFLNILNLYVVINQDEIQVHFFLTPTLSKHFWMPAVYPAHCEISKAK